MSTDTHDQISIDPETLLDALVSPGSHTFFGIRHHSPACARAVIQAAEELRPAAVAVEMPADMADMLPWMWHTETIAPVAVAVSDKDAGPRGMGFYPFADFSPELAIIRWAGRNNIPIHCIDLPVGARADIDEDGDSSDDVVDVSELVGQEAWDTKVESRSIGASWQQVQKAALAVGLGARLAQPTIDTYTQAREAHMRACLDDLPENTLIVVGSFHCQGLVTGEKVKPKNINPVVTSIVRYSFEQLDYRSGYASGIRDPQWQQGIWECSTVADVDALTKAMITDVARTCRTDGEPAGTGEVAEACRFAGDLCRIRHLPAPGRREVIEALTSVFAHGNVTGRGRGIARAMQKVLVGERHGDLPADAPIPALEAHTRAEMERLGLSAKERQRAVSRRIEPFKGGKDFERHLLLMRLNVLDVDYVRDKTNGTNRGLEARSYTVECAFTATTAAGLAAVAYAGVTLEQAVSTILGAKLGALSAGDDEVNPQVVLEVIGAASQTGAGEVLERALQVMETDVLHRLGFGDAVTATELLTGIAGDREPAARLLTDKQRDLANAMAEKLGAVIVREIRGIAGSTEVEHARQLGQAAGLISSYLVSITAALQRVRESGSPLMQGAAYAVLDAVQDYPSDPQQTAEFIGSWIDQSSTPETRHNLQQRMVGYLCASRGVWCDSPIMDNIIDRVAALPDDHFVQSLPPLRGAFDTVPAAERERFLDYLAEKIGRISTALTVDPALLAVNATADVEARRRLEALGLADVSFTPAMRWRLILGAEPEKLQGQAKRMASALDELYGGPGSDQTGEADGRVRGAGSGPSQLGVRNWADEIQALFGDDHIQEIFGQAAEKGRPDVITSLNADDVRPSVELLTTVLNLKGALPESRLRQLRPLVAKIVEELSRVLAQQLAPVLAGIAQAKPTRRRTARIDLPATIRRNMKNVVSHEGRAQIVPVTPIFRAPERHVSPWHIIVLVDVSGSMEPSTVYAAITAAILAGVDTFKVSFITFDTSVIDLSDSVEDPLELLLEIKVGGGTNIAQGVRFAATKVTNPSKTVVVLISDFEEWGSVNNLTTAIRNLADSGVKLIGCAALDDEGKAAYNVGIAESVAAAGMRVASVSPMQLARWVGEVLQ